MRVPLEERESRRTREGSHVDLWTAKKVEKIPFKTLEEDHPSKPKRRGRIKKVQLGTTKVHWQLEMEETAQRLPVVRAVTEFTGTIVGRGKGTNILNSTFKVFALTYNVQHDNWEPLIEFCSRNHVDYKPWEVSIKVG